MMTTKNSTHTPNLNEFIYNQQNVIRRTCKNVAITFHPAMRWITFNLHDSLRVPVIKHIKDRIFPELRGQIIVRDIPIPAKEDQSIPYTQLQCYSRSPDIASRLFDFINRNQYSVATPIFRLTADKTRYHLRWNVPLESNHRDIIQHWDSLNTNSHVHKCDISNYIMQTKINATWYLNNMFKRAINSLHTNNYALRRYKNFLIHKLIHKHDVCSANNHDFIDKDITEGIQRFPFLQVYDPTVQPSNASVIRIRNLSIAFLNINGNAFNKIRSDHPYLFQLIKMHKIDIIAFIDTRYHTSPSWSI
eukprot:335173_1